MLGYALKDVNKFEIKKEGNVDSVILHLKFLSYQLYLDDREKLLELIQILQSIAFKKMEEEKKSRQPPSFYKR
jgi:hypothetical protein